MRCEQGYLCDVCGEEVEDVTESALYLQYVIGEIPARELMSHPERHLRCHPYLAQFIVDPGFPPMSMDGPFAKSNLEPAEMARLEQLLTRGWKRLQEVRALGIPISEYPLAKMTNAE
jgi:hypothetical protein